MFGNKFTIVKSIVENIKKLNQAGDLKYLVPGFFNYAILLLFIPLLDCFI